MKTYEQLILDCSNSYPVFGTEIVTDSLKKTDVSRATLNAILARMVKKGLLMRVCRGKYANVLSGKRFSFAVSNTASDLYKAVHVKFPYAEICVYEGQWLSSFMHHMASNNSVYLEVERDAAESVFEWLRSEGKNAYYRPDSEFIYRYIDLSGGPVIVKILTSQSPLFEKDGIKVPTVEKLLVDMYCDKDFFYLQGEEYVHIFKAVQDAYSLNVPSMMRYASRRNAGNDIRKLMEDIGNDIS